MTPTTEQRLELGWAKIDDALERKDAAEWDRLSTFWCALLIQHQNEMLPGLWELPEQHDYLSTTIHSSSDGIPARTDEPRASQGHLEIA